MLKLIAAVLVAGLLAGCGATTSQTAARKSPLNSHAAMIGIGY